MHLVVSLVYFGHRGLMLVPWNLHYAFLLAMCLKERIISEWCRNNKTIFEVLGSDFQETSADVSCKKFWHCFFFDLTYTFLKPKYLTNPSSEIQDKELDKSSKAEALWYAAGVHIPLLNTNSEQLDGSAEAAATCRGVPVKAICSTSYSQSPLPDLSKVFIGSCLTSLRVQVACSIAQRDDLTHISASWQLKSSVT